MIDVMDLYLRKYILEIRSLGPVFIGSGKSVGKKEYIYDRAANHIYFPDAKKMFFGLQKRGKLAAYEEYLLKDNSDLYFFFKNNDISKNEYMKWVSYDVAMGDKGLITKNTKEILTFMKDSHGDAYIPGSSLKGALRTILQCCYYLNHETEAKRMKSSIQKAPEENRSRYLAREDRKMDVQAIHANLYEESSIDNQVNDTLSGLIVGDSGAVDPKRLCIVQKVDQTVDGTPKPFPLLRECIAPGTAIQFPITIDSRICKIGPKYIVDAVAQFYQYYKSEFSERFRKAPPIQNHANTFFLGGGAGYVSKTCTYSVASGKEGVQMTSKIINATLPRNVQRQHGHDKDVSLGASPHMLKCTNYNGKEMQMGACCITKMKRIKEL